MKFEIQIKNINKHETEETVNGRELHKNLEVGKNYSDWIKSQIKRLELIENEDYIKYRTPSRGSVNYNELVEYNFTIDNAKHIAMISLTNKGREVRQYFINAEKRLKKILHENYVKAIEDSNKNLKKSVRLLETNERLNFERLIQQDNKKALKASIKGIKFHVGTFLEYDYEKIKRFVINQKKKLKNSTQEPKELVEIIKRRIKKEFDI